MNVLLISALLMGVGVITTNGFDFMGHSIRAKLATEYKTTKSISEGIIVQPVDHFSPSANWNQRVFMNDEHYRIGGPALFFFSGKLVPDDEQYWLEQSLGTQMAEEYGGVVYAIEPRFYGESRPTEDLSLENLQYLTVNQNLADFQNVIQTLIEALEASFGPTKAVAFGYGIGSTYATWLHQRYPGLLAGVLASSAQLEVIPNYYRYFPDISETLQKHAPGICFERMIGGLAEATDIIAAGDGEQIQELFNFIEPVDTTDEREVAAFFATIGGILGAFLENRDASVIDYMCGIIDDANHDSDVEDLAFFVRYVYGNEPIQASFRVIVEGYRQTSWDTEAVQSGLRQLSFISCNEMGWFKSAPEIPVHIFTETCAEVYNIPSSEILSRSEWTNSLFQISPNLTNVYFTQGDMDPFRWTGILYDLNEDSPADVIPNVGKSFDLPRMSDDDSYETQVVKGRAFYLFGRWIE